MKGGYLIYQVPRQDSGLKNIPYTRHPKKCFPQIYRDLYVDAMLVPTWMGTNIWRTETNKNIFFRVFVQKREFFPRGTHQH